MATWDPPSSPNIGTEYVFGDCTYVYRKDGNSGVWTPKSTVNPKQANWETIKTDITSPKEGDKWDWNGAGNSYYECRFEESSDVPIWDTIDFKVLQPDDPESPPGDSTKKCLVTPEETEGSLGNMSIGPFPGAPFDGSDPGVVISWDVNITYPSKNLARANKKLILFIVQPHSSVHKFNFTEKGIHRIDSNGYCGAFCWNIVNDIGSKTLGRIKWPTATGLIGDDSNVWPQKWKLSGDHGPGRPPARHFAGGVPHVCGMWRWTYTYNLSYPSMNFTEFNRSVFPKHFYDSSKPHGGESLIFDDSIEPGFRIHSISNPKGHGGCIGNTDPAPRTPAGWGNTLTYSKFKWTSDNDPAKFDNIPKSVIWEGTYGLKKSNTTWSVNGEINFEPSSGTEYYMLDAAAWQFSSLSNFNDTSKELLKHSVILKDGKQYYLHDIATGYRRTGGDKPNADPTTAIAGLIITNDNKERTYSGVVTDVPVGSDGLPTGYYKDFPNAGNVDDATTAQALELGRQFINRHEWMTGGYNQEYGGWWHGGNKNPPGGAKDDFLLLRAEEQIIVNGKMCWGECTDIIPLDVHPLLNQWWYSFKTKKIAVNKKIIRLVMQHDAIGNHGESHAKFYSPLFLLTSYGGLLKS